MQTLCLDRLSAWLVKGQNIAARSPLIEIQRVGDRPLFLTDSAGNERVAIHHSHQLEAAAKCAGANLAVWYVDGADHLRASALYPAEFEERLVGFFRSTLGDR